MFPQTDQLAQAKAHADAAKNKKGRRSESAVGLVGVMFAPSHGLVKHLWLGIFLFLFSFGVKQLVVNYSLNKFASTTSATRLRAQQNAEISQVRLEASLLGLEIDDLNQKIFKERSSAKSAKQSADEKKSNIP